MRFVIPAETFLRMSNAATPYGADEYPACQSVRLEYLNGRYYAVATNSRIIAVEYLGPTTEANGAVNVANLPQYEQWSNVETWTFDWYPPPVNVLMFNDSASVLAAPDDVPRFRDWFNIFPENVPTKAKGAFFMETELIAKLGAASPSGQLCFAQYVDRKQLAIVRDMHDPNWIGGFISDTRDFKAEPATIPEWMK